MDKTCILALVAVLLAGCGNSASTATSPAAGTTGERLKQDVEAAGRDLKAAATEAATQVKPALEKAKEESREAAHTAAQKVADWTATQPATMPSR